MAPHLSAAWAILRAAALGFVPFPQPEELVSPPQQGHPGAVIPTSAMFCSLGCEGRSVMHSFHPFQNGISRPVLIYVEMRNQPWQDSIFLACVKYMTIASVFRIVQYLTGTCSDLGFAFLLPSLLFSLQWNQEQGGCAALWRPFRSCVLNFRNSHLTTQWNYCLQWITIPEQGEVPRSEKLQNSRDSFSGIFYYYYFF